MSKKRVYIAGPIAGKVDGNKPKFDLAERELNALGYEAVNPHNIAPYWHGGSACPKNSPVGEEGHAAACHMRTDIAALVTCDIIYLLEGWEDSAGARLEFLVAQMCGLRIIYERRRLFSD